MNRTLKLTLFELKKTLNHKKAILFLLALNIMPLLASIGLAYAYLQFRSITHTEPPFPMLYAAVKNTFLIHFKLFALVAPFFMSLIVGDSISTELNKGYIKTLLLTPINRWQILTAKALAIMFFLIIAVAIGGLLIQADLILAKFIGGNGLQGLTASADSVSLVTVWSAAQLLIMSFVGNLAVVGYFILFSLFFESAVVMAFAAISVLMGVHVFYYMANNLFAKLDPWYEKAAEWCFTRHLDDLFDMENINGILDGTKAIMDSNIFNSCMASLGWAVFFFALAVWIFSRKQILH